MERPLTKNIRPGEAPLTLEEYERAGGYRALAKALREMTPDQVLAEVTAANLKGRGGAGFSAGLKWSFVPKDTPKPRYLIANADEMEPGTFKDRYLLEGDPHQLLEVVAILERAGLHLVGIRDQVSRLRGVLGDEAPLQARGGAGFSAGLKWSFVPKDTPKPRYLIANADEMEPGTFKDRYLLEGDPHQLLEGMIISAYAIQADVAYLFLRWEYRQARLRLLAAIEEAKRAGYLGRDLLGSGWDLELHLHVSAGRYMCGEEMGLLNALEGKRATPRAKPPYPQLSGLFGRPTIVNNVETLANVPHIIEHGASWFHGLSLAPGEGGTKLYGVSGKVKRPGLWELPLGTTLRELLEEHAGGMQAGLTWRALLPGGASTSFLLPEHIDLPLGFASVQRAGSRLGTGCAIVLDDATCPIGMLENLERFFARESCGLCTPCRDGLPWTAKTLGAIDAGRGEPIDLERLALHARFLGPGYTYCALAPGAAEPLMSGLACFRAEFEEHVNDRACRFRRETE